MNWYLLDGKTNQPVGPYSEQQIRDYLKSRQVSSDQLAAPEGATDWKKLEEYQQFRKHTKSAKAGGIGCLLVVLFLAMLIMCPGEPPAFKPGANVITTDNIGFPYIADSQDTLTLFKMSMADPGSYVGVREDLLRTNQVLSVPMNLHAKVIHANASQAFVEYEYDGVTVKGWMWAESLKLVSPPDGETSP